MPEAFLLDCKYPAFTWHARSAACEPPAASPSPWILPISLLTKRAAVWVQSPSFPGALRAPGPGLWAQPCLPARAQDSVLLYQLEPANLLYRLTCFTNAS